MPQPYHLWPDITIDGSPLPAQMESRLEQVIVDHHQHLPSMFAIAFHDPYRDVITKLGADFGSKVSIKLSPPGGAPETLITGEITGLEAEYDSSHMSTIVRGYDPSHRLHRGRKTATFSNQTDSDIAQKVASDGGLTVGQIDPTSTVHEHASQANQSDWDFLKSRAREIGYEMGIDELGQFYFRKPKEASSGPSAGDYQQHSDPLQLVFGDDLIEFRPRITSAEQVSTVNVRSWDPKQKQAMVGTASAATVAAKVQDDPSSLSSTFGGPTLTLVNRPLDQQPSADSVAKAAAEIIGGAFAEADGIAKGNAKLKAGSTVSVGVVGDRFKGKYTLTGARHVFGENGYRTQFVVSGRQDRSLLGLASLGASNGHTSAGGAPINGVVVAMVSNTQDPDKDGRVKLKFPWLDDSYESNWARVMQLGAGPSRGAVWLPEVNDEVLVAFEHGDIRRPYVVGGLWNGQDKPPQGDDLIDGSDGKVLWRGFVTRKGHKIILSDDDGKSRIDLISSDGKFKLTLDEANSEIHITSDGAVKVESKQDMTLDSGGNLNLSAKQGISVKAQTNLDLQAQSGATIDGGPQLQVKSSGQLTISSGMVDVNNGALQVM